jgi:outer membrane protein TolC
MRIASVKSYWLLCAWTALTIGCAGSRSARETVSSAREPAPEELHAAQSSTAAVLPVAFSESQVSSPQSPELRPAALQPLPNTIGSAPSQTQPIDLASAMLLADGENLRIAFAREQWREAVARSQTAEALWLPSLRAGLNYNKHEGVIQDVMGQAFDASRGAFYAGSGAGAVGAGSPAVPGLNASFHLADAIFQPLAARQFARSRGSAAAAVHNDVLLEVAQAYLGLLQAVEDAAIADAVLRDAQRLADLTAAYARTGQGLEADADRARVELSLRRNEVHRAEEAVQVASARLAQLLRLDPVIVLNPVEPVVAPVLLVSEDREVRDLIAEGLSRRPELAESRFLVGQAVERLERERYAPLIPSVLLGLSYGGFGAGEGSFISGLDDRMDFDAFCWWELRNLGAGERAARNTARSQVRQARVRQLSILDQVAREVAQEHARVVARRRQIESAREGAQAAAASYRRNLERIENAQGLPIEVLQAIQAMAQARREYLRAVIDYNSAQFALYRALGWPGELPAAL